MSRWHPLKCVHERNCLSLLTALEALWELASECWEDQNGMDQACKNLFEVKTFLSRVAYSFKRPVWILMWWHVTVEREKVMMCLSAALQYRSFFQMKATGLPLFFLKTFHHLPGGSFRPIHGCWDSHTFRVICVTDPPTHSVVCCHLWVVYLSDQHMRCSGHVWKCDWLQKHLGRRVKATLKVLDGWHLSPFSLFYVAFSPPFGSLPSWLSQNICLFCPEWNHYCPQKKICYL